MRRVIPFSHTARGDVCAELSPFLPKNEHSLRRVITVSPKEWRALCASSLSFSPKNGGSLRIISLLIHTQGGRVGIYTTVNTPGKAGWAYTPCGTHPGRHGGVYTPCGTHLGRHGGGYTLWYTPRETWWWVYTLWYTPREVWWEVYPGVYTLLSMVGGIPWCIYPTILPWVHHPGLPCH